jgi:hypothetical protein
MDGFIAFDAVGARRRYKRMVREDSASKGKMLLNLLSLAVKIGEL